MDIVFIEGLQIDALIGIYDWERRIRQPLVFDLEMQFDNTIPAASDAIADTLDYKAVSKRLMEFVGQSDFGLVETLAERVAAIVLDEFGVERVRLKLSKPGAVRGARAVGVMIERSRQPGAPRRAQAAPAAVSATGLPATAATPEVEAAKFAAAVPRGGATPVAATADAPASAPIEPEPVPPAEAVDQAQSAPDGAEVEAREAVEPIASAEPVEPTGPAAAADSTESIETADVAESDATAQATEAAESTVTRDVAEAATRDDANAHSPLEAALLAAVSGWHSPRPAPAGLDAALNALGEKGGRKPRKNGASPAADGVTADAAPDAVATTPEPPALPAVAEAPPIAPEPAALPADAPEAGAPATPPARPRANFMQDLDEAPVRPVSVPAPVAPAEPPPLPVEDAAPPAEPPPLPIEDESTEATAPLAPAVATPARVVPAFRTAPPPPPRPRNPASDLGRTTRPAYLSLGSNIEPEKNLRSALMALRARFGEVIVSPVYRMPAVGFEGPEFLNAAAIIDSDLDPFALTRWLHGIESAHGRMRSTVKNSSRTLDMDIIFFDDLVLDMPGGLQLPRPELRHAFVLKPLVDIAPGFIDPVRGVPLADVWAAHAERETKFSTVMI